MKKTYKYLISENESIRNSIKKMDIEHVEFLAVHDQNRKIIGVFTMGDFRRYVLQGLDINEKISKIINTKFKFLEKSYLNEDVVKLFNSDSTINDVPVLNKSKKLIDVLYRRDYLSQINKNNDINKIKKIPVVIMAGGKGKRMDPFTRILPKSLIPIGNEPILKIIMDKFRNFGFKKFLISINDKGQMIKSFFHDNELPYEVKFIEEKKPLGTVGSLSKIKSNDNGTLFITNCDIVINTNYKAIYDFHKSGNHDLTLVASMRNYKIPYGVCKLKGDGKLKTIEEKPEYDFLVNTGLYVLNSSILKLIPKDTYFDMTDLISKVKAKGYSVGVFPVSGESWFDIGQWPEYNKNVDKINILTK